MVFIYFSDDQTLSNYTRQIFNTLNIGDNTDVNIESVGEIGMENILPSCDNINNEFKWNHDAIKLLLDLRLKKEPEFNRPICKKKKLWSVIAEEMKKVGHYTVTGDICDIKYRNLLATYKVNKKKKNQSGEGAVSWEFFNVFDEVLGEKACIDPPKDTIGSSYSTASTSSCSEAENHPQPPTIERNCKKRKISMTFNEYLVEKLKRDEEKEKERAKKEEERWGEKKILKEKEINVLEALAKAIAKKYE